ncbi:MAG: sulfurtransferase [Rhodospirillales bacterium]|nr:sulfurtransferase [Rhodospirillales bacterium]
MTALLSFDELRQIASREQADFSGGRVVILDATFILPGTSETTAYQNFCQARIATAQFFDIDDIADLKSDLPHMLPSPEVFSQKVSALGISNESHVIIYGQNGIAMGPARAWWMFRAFGHENVQILNGSLASWKASGGSLVTTGQPAEPPSLPSQPFHAVFHPELVCARCEVEDISTRRAAPILDARPAPRFDGIMPEPRPGLALGHIPGSRNIPAGNLVDGETGCLKNKSDLQHYFDDDILQAEIAPVMTCGSGVTACVIALALYELGRSDAKVYDGSWAEWGKIA